MQSQPLRGQKALVTGASSGIGEGVARALGAAGADVAVNYAAQADAARRIAGEIAQGGVATLAIRADVSKEAEVEAMFEEMLSAWGTIDILVSNAGLQRDAAFTSMTLEQWNTVIGVNLTGMFLCARAATRAMVKQGVRPGVARGRQDHLHVFCSRGDPVGRPRELCRVQGRREALHAVARPGSGALPDPG